MTKPPAKEIDRDAVHEKMAGVAVPESVGSNVPALRQTSQLHRPPNGFLDPPPGRGPVDANDGAAARSDKLEDRDQCVLQLGMDRNYPAPPSLTHSDPDSGLVGL